MLYFTIDFCLERMQKKKNRRKFSIITKHSFDSRSRKAIFYLKCFLTVVILHIFINGVQAVSGFDTFREEEKHIVLRVFV